ncbi:ficolin-1-like [Drosophila hydei]|uniref:Ficolin-1-like n=1 Tax=Drosophila hydei TaxID=7224 RepID=A0A6J2SSH6_DROHY|nr:ficolin-1-like [Drosophila hydei]
MDELCGAHCYTIVKPLLQYAASVRSKEIQFNELTAKIQSREAIIKTLESQLEASNSHAKYCLTNADLFVNKQTLVNNIQDLIALGKKSKDQCSEDFRKKDSEILTLKSQDIKNEIKIKELEKRLSEREVEVKGPLSSSCIGKITGIFQIHVPGSDPFEVACDSSLVDSGWTVIQRRQDGSENFNRSMNDYRSGFGKLDGEFFIGLDKLHLLTKSQRHELYIYMETDNKEVGNARYNQFLIGGEQQDFKILLLGAFSGNAGNGLADSLNMGFSTPDVDNDNWWTANCAGLANSGWWFNNCGLSNLNGVYKAEDRPAYADGVAWSVWKYESLKFVQIMIKPKQ